MTSSNLLNFSIPRHRVGLRVNFKCQPGDSPVLEESWKHLNWIAFYNKQPEEKTQRPDFFLLVDLQEKKSDLGSGERKK